MGEFKSEVRFVEITGVEQYRNQPILTADARSTDNFDEIIIFKRPEFDKLFGPEGVDTTDRAIFVRLTDLFEDGVARAEVHKFRVFGSIPADVDHYTKVLKAKFKQGSARAEINGGKCALESTAPVTGSGTVKIEFDRKADTYRATIQDYTTPPPVEGETVEATIPKRGDNDVAVVLTPDGRYTVQLDSSAPFPGDITVKILKASHPIRGTLINYAGSLPSVGDTVETTINDQTVKPNVSVDGVTFEVALSEPPVTTGGVTIELTETDQSIRGEIVDEENLPEVGDVLTVDATRGETPTRVCPGGDQYEIVLDTPLIMDGEVDIEIITTGESIEGTPHSYSRNLPERGKVVRAEVTNQGGKILAIPDLQPFVIYIEEDKGYRGPAKVKITGASPDAITGRIIEEVNNKSQPRSKNRFNNPFR